MKIAMFDTLSVKALAAPFISRKILGDAFETVLSLITHDTKPVEPSQPIKLVTDSDQVEDLPELASNAKLLTVADTPRHSELNGDSDSQQATVTSGMDILTGLINRGLGTERLEKELERAHRKQMPVTLVAMDLDDFTRLNETHGRMVGDACLKFFADLAQATVRKGDFVARWGADEFLILLWDTRINEVEEVLDRIRYRLSFSQDIREAGLTLSATFGYATSLPGERATSLCKRTQDALEKAKKERSKLAPIAKTSIILSD